MNYIEQLNENIISMFKSSLSLFFHDPAKILFLGKTLSTQKRAVKTRKRWEEQGVHVPPFMIISITNECNLKCTGCYASIHQQTTADVKTEEMDELVLRRLLSEALDLGISQILVAGGEPFTRLEIIEIMRDYPDLIFVIFTNGMLLNPAMIQKLKKVRNIIPIISLEGKEKETDDRRGAGTYLQLKKTFQKLKKAGIIYGISFTLTSLNFHVAIDKTYIDQLISSGVKVFFFVEYVPVAERTDHLIITNEHRDNLKVILHDYRLEFPAIFISFPGDEEELGGCLAAGRGFIHINPEGRIEPCPFAPYSDSNIQELSLKEALKSNLLATIRENKEILEEAEAGGGCTLWAKRELVRSLLDQTKK